MGAHAGDTPPPAPPHPAQHYIRYPTNVALSAGGDEYDALDGPALLLFLSLFTVLLFVAFLKLRCYQHGLLARQGPHPVRGGCGRHEPAQARAGASATGVRARKGGGWGLAQKPPGGVHAQGGASAPGPCPWLLLPLLRREEGRRVDARGGRGRWLLCASAGHKVSVHRGARLPRP